MIKQLKQAMSYFEQGDLLSAEAACKQALKKDSNNVECLHLSAVIATHQGNFEIAKKRLLSAVKIEPGYLPVLFDLANLFASSHELSSAIKYYDKIIALAPHEPSIYVARGNAQIALGRREAALSSYGEAISRQPENVTAHSNRAAVLSQLNRFQEAVEAYDKALAIDPNYIDALNGRGVNLLALGRQQDAISDYDKALALSPEHPLSHMNRSFCFLLHGDLPSGWRGYEWRQSRLDIQRAGRFATPQWSGQPLQDKTVLLHAEQGLGDTIHFCRYASLLVQRGARVIMMVQKPLVGLLSCISGVSEVIDNHDQPPAHDYQCTYLSLPLGFNTSLESIPASQSYIQPAETSLAKWRQKLSQLREGKRPAVGIVWAGSTIHQNDHNRSVPLSDMLSIFSGQVDLVSLQKECSGDDRSLLAATSDLLHFGEELADFSDTAALIDTLDLVISVDTSVAHLAAAMGKPTWILVSALPDWRWFLDSDKSPWYPSARLFRQSRAGDWQSVFLALQQALVAHFHN